MVGISGPTQKGYKMESQTKKPTPKYFSFRNAEDILREKGQLSEVTQAASLTDLSSQTDHDTIKKYLHDKGWEVEVSKFPVGSYRLDAFRRGTGLEIERSLIDAIHRSLFRCIWSFQEQQLEMLVFIVPSYKEPKFANVKRDIEAFKNAIPFPVYLLGVSKKQ
jgi:hypothetical protein